jgi:hypothetical protein
MDEVLTIAEMEKRFCSEWVLVEDPQTDEYLKVRSGRVRYHSKDRDDVYRRAAELRPKRCAFVYTGRLSLPENTAVLI